MRKSFIGNVLSKEELKQTTGGVYPQLTCWCRNGQGGFSPHPNSTPEQLVQLTGEYCGDSGASCSYVEV